MLYKVWGVRKIVLLTMLEHQDTAILQQVLLENQSRDGGQFLECVRGIGKNKVELLFARFDIAEHSSEILPVPENRSRALIPSKSI